VASGIIQQVTGSSPKQSQAKGAYMTLVAKGLKKSDVPSSGGTLATIAGSGGSKLPVQILEFTQDVTGNISIPDTNLYGYFKINMGSHNIDGAGAACFTNDNVFDADISGSGTINSNADFTINTTGTATTANISSKGIDIAVTNGASFHTKFNTSITQNNSPFNGNQSGGNWNVIRENAGGTTGTWTATVLDANTNLSGVILGKNLTVKKNGTTVATIAQSNSNQSWGPVSCVPGDVIVWTCSAGIGGGGTINRNQTWSWSGSPKIGYSSHTGGGNSGAFNAKQIAVTNNNTTNLDLTLQSGTTGISTDTTVAAGANLSLTGSGSTISTSTWALVAKITDQTENGVLYSAVAAFNGTNTTTDAAGVPTDGIDLTAFSGTFNRVI